MKKARKKENKIIKSGFSPNGKQMFKNKKTGKRFIADDNRDHRGHPEKLREQALELYLEGVGLRSIGRYLGCVHGTVITWIRAASARLQPLSTTLLDESKIGVVELDEMWHFHKKKEEKNGFGSEYREKQCK